MLLLMAIQVFHCRDWGPYRRPSDRICDHRKSFASMVPDRRAMATQLTCSQVALDRIHHRVPDFLPFRPWPLLHPRNIRRESPLHPTQALSPSNERTQPVLLQRKAAHLRHSTGNWALHAKSDEEELTGRTIVEKHLALPLRMLVTEPIIACLALYNAFVYGLLYLLFEAFPVEFQENRGWTPVQSSLPFLAVLVGVVISGGIQAAYQPIFWKKLDTAHEQGFKNDPEARLPPMILGAVLFCASLFWFGGGSGADKSPAICIVGAGCLGAGFILIFQNAVNYLIDAFTVHAASAQAANTFLRSLAGAGFPLFATPMFRGLGVNVASYILGGVAALMIPMPIIFYVFGSKLRGASRYNPDRQGHGGSKKSDEKETV